MTFSDWWGNAYIFGFGTRWLESLVIPIAEKAWAASATAEREACAHLCDDMTLYTGFDCAAKIRERHNVGIERQATACR